MLSASPTQLLFGQLTMLPFYFGYATAISKSFCASNLVQLSTLVLLVSPIGLVSQLGLLWLSLDPWLQLVPMWLSLDPWLRLIPLFGMHSLLVFAVQFYLTVFLLSSSLPTS